MRKFNFSKSSLIILSVLISGGCVIPSQGNGSSKNTKAEDIVGNKPSVTQGSTTKSSGQNNPGNTQTGGQNNTGTGNSTDNTQPSSQDTPTDNTNTVNSGAVNNVTNSTSSANNSTGLTPTEAALSINIDTSSPPLLSSKTEVVIFLDDELPKSQIN